ncbi:caspase, EACC1-associated type [Saccharopolyspora gloriosae]|uniref:caspase, EACC1-associated type n=1 Tax=Saccharopolyspora gloriosae TaxID=455344 RepID=UPI001FB5E32C|nr:caspase family protein [Saccharopolyspora gloriosae]
MSEPADRDYSRSRAVLMGTWDYTDFEQVLAVQRSFNRMRDLLLDPVCGPWPEESIVALKNRSTLGTTHVELIEAFIAATDVALFYYVGHGIYDHRERLCLTVGDTRKDSNFTAATALPFEAVRDAFRASHAAVKIAVLDCCYAGLATEDYGRLAADHLPPVSGAYLLMSSSAVEMSWYELEEVADAQTYFTKALVDTVRAGIPGGPAGLTFDHLFRVVADQLIENGRPEPGRRIEDHAAGWVFASNNAPESPAEPGADPETVFREAYRRETKEGVERLPAIAALYRAAAAAGHTPSMNRLGQIEEGRVQARMQGIEPGPVNGTALSKATQWYTRAAEAGDPVGPLHLGQLYELHYRDRDRALYWYALAARRGNSAAREQLTGLEQRIRLGITGSEPPRDGDDEQPAQARAAPDDTLARLATDMSRRRWLDDWGGVESLAIAQCLDILIDACGGANGEWAALDETEQERILADFIALRPRKADLASTARRFYEAAGPGNLRDHAAANRRPAR